MAKHRKADKLIGGVYVQSVSYDNAERTVFLDRGSGWTIAGFCWGPPSHGTKAGQKLTENECQELAEQSIWLENNGYEIEQPVDTEGDPL